MSEVAISARARGDGAFNPVTIGIVALVGILAFVAMLVLGAYAPDMRPVRNGGSHALSNGATGFSGIVRLAEATGRAPQIVRSLTEYLDDVDALIVATPDSGTDDLSQLLAHRDGKPILLVMPKWQTVRDPGHPGWVMTTGLLPRFDPERLLAPQQTLHVAHQRIAGTPLRTVADKAPAEMRFTAPGGLQTVSGPGLKPIVTAPDGSIVVAEVKDSRVYILADPDLLANRGMGDIHQAAAALALLDYLNPNGDELLFDVTLNGFGRSKSPLKLAFDPPFLAATLALAGALLLAGLHSLVRFGAPRRPQRALAFGKAALVDNAAALVRKARRQAALGARYAELIRARAAAAFGAPAKLQGEALDAYLDGLGGRPFSKLAAAAGAARDGPELLGAAQALHDWQREKDA